MKQAFYIMMLVLFSSIQSMAQTTITYTYDTAGNRTGRSAPVQTMAGVTDIPSVESVAISKIVSQLMATPVNGVHLSKEAVSIPVRSETALWAAGPFPGEQNRSLSLTKGITDLPGRQNRPPTPISASPCWGAWTASTCP